MRVITQKNCDSVCRDIVRDNKVPASTPVTIEYEMVNVGVLSENGVMFLGTHRQRS